ncbi:MAG: hypothetical protein LKH07_05100 [Acetobacter peroxydans]|jgi:hypothetical protein|nr:hypothetical protein [Acetobacter peroxydans]
MSSFCIVSVCISCGAGVGGIILLVSARARLECRVVLVRIVQIRIAADNRRIRRIMARNARRQAKVARWMEGL